MKDSTKYLILFLMDIFLIVTWPALLYAGAYSAPWMYFLIGMVWYSDILDAFKHWTNYRFYKGME